MKSPFPGMDPYLEARWSDVHVTLIGFVKEALQPLLPSDLRARSEERVLLESKGDEWSFKSDVAVVDLGSRGPRATGATVGDPSVSTLEPIIVRVHRGPQLHRWVQIIAPANGGRVITVIEILSPWNKGPGRTNAEYRKKLDDYEAAGVNLVEIDLLRSSRHRLPVDYADLPENRRGAYVACVRRSGDPDRYEMYPMSLRHPLPKIPIPLRPTEQDVMLDLQPLIERVYGAGGHDDIDYSQPPQPPLEGEDAAWADKLLREAGRR